MTVEVIKPEFQRPDAFGKESKKGGQCKQASWEPGRTDLDPRGLEKEVGADGGRLLLHLPVEKLGPT